VTLAHVDAMSGASGDMLLGAVVDAGASPEAISAAVGSLALDGWALDVAEVSRAGLRATHAHVLATETGVVRTWGGIRDLLGRCDLPPRVRQRALGTFRRLAEVEARIHRRDVEHVHFHEVGGLDALVDVVGVCAGLDLLGVTALSCGPVAQGIGMVRSEHGLLPIPAPAVLELLASVRAPTYSTGEPTELCTPTGAALLSEWVSAWGPMPPMVVEQVGYGAGSRDLERPNVLRLVVGSAMAGAQPSGQALVLEATLDDLPGELVPPVLDKLRAAGASDAWARPVVMKKGRPGIEIACIAAPNQGAALRNLLFRETTTLGVRGRLVEKWALERSWVSVQVGGADVRLKLGHLDGEVVNVAPEFVDCEAAARATGLPLKEVYARARAAYPPPPSETEAAVAPPVPPASA